MDDLTADAWADGLALYEDRWAFTAVAPRDHVEWWFDVAAVMRGETADPRGWASLDPYEEDVDREVEAFAWIEPPHQYSGRATLQFLRRRTPPVLGSITHGLSRSRRHECVEIP